jgi:diacylglycerol kinase family enzyme
MQVVAEILANRRDGDYVARIQTPWIEVSAPAVIPVNLDGEPVNGASFRFACEPGCVRMVLPADCPCLRDAIA